MSPAATAVLAYLPSPDRGVWYLGPVPIRAYALCIIIGIVIAVLWGERRFVARGGQPGTVTDVAVFAVPFGLVGGRLYHVATDWQTYFGPGGNTVDALKIWQGGLGIWGAIALGAVGAWIGCRRRGVPLPFFADAVAPGIVAAQAVGRLGNWFNQELYGAPTTLPWGLEIYRRVDPETGAPDPLGGVALDRTPIEIVQPTFLYELIWNLLVAALVVWADRRFRLGHGRAFAVYVAGYTAGRFVIEQLRTDYATRVFGDIRINVVVAAVVFVAAALYVALGKRGREVLAVPAAAAAERAEAPVAVGAGTAGAGPGPAAATAPPVVTNGGAEPGGGAGDETGAAGEPDATAAAGADGAGKADGTGEADGTGSADGAGKADGTSEADGTGRADRAGKADGAGEAAAAVDEADAAGKSDAATTGVGSAEGAAAATTGGESTADGTTGHPAPGPSTPAAGGPERDATGTARDEPAAPGATGSAQASGATARTPGGTGPATVGGDTTADPGPTAPEPGERRG